MAFGTYRNRVEKVATLPVPVKQRAAFATRHVYISPMNDRHQDWMQVHAFRGQAVFVANRRFLIGDFLQDLLLDQLAQPVNQHGPRYPQALLEIFKPPDSQEAITQDK